MLQRPGGFGILSQWKIAGFGVHHVLRGKLVVTHQVRSLIKPMLPERRCCPGILQGSVADGPEGAEMRMVKAAAGTQPANGVQQGAISIGGGSDHKLNRHS